MREIDSSSFNAQVQEQIEKIRYIVNHLITSDNIKYFDADVIRQYRDSLSLISPLYTDWTHNSNVNSFEMSKIKQMLSHLNIFLQKTTIRYFSIYPNKQPEATGDYVSSEVILQVPEGYDGRRSFPFYRIKPSTHHVYPEMFASEYANFDTSIHTARIVYSPTARRIKVNIKFPKDVVGPPAIEGLMGGENSFLEGMVFLWRDV